MKLLATAILVLLLAPNLWALDSLGRWVDDDNYFSIEDAVGGFKTASPSENGNLREVRVRLDITGISSLVKCAVYHGEDTVLVDSTEIIDCNTGRGWYTFKFIDSAMIYSDSSYAIVATAPGGAGTVKISYSVAGGDWIFDLIKTYGIWPDPFTSFDHTNPTPCNIYATYEPAVAAAAIMIIQTQ